MKYTTAEHYFKTQLESATAVLNAAKTRYLVECDLWLASTNAPFDAVENAAKELREANKVLLKVKKAVMLWLFSADTDAQSRAGTLLSKLFG